MVNNNPIGINNKPDNDDDEIYNPINHDLTDSSDEQTLDEEEYLAAQDEINEQEEINNLEKEKDMPLKELLALYNYDHDNINYNVKTNGNENIKQTDIEDNFETTVENLKLQDSTEANFNVHSHLQELLQPISENGNQEDSVENDPDFTLKADKSEWKTTIMVGKEYQVEIPKMNSNEESITATAPYESKDVLLWDPKIMSDDEIVDFLRIANSSKSNNNKCQVKDDAQLLYALMQSDYNVDDTLKSKKQNSNVLYDEITPFSDTECLGFEQGLIKHGKDFWKIQQNFVKTRSVKELVHFYYLWKKTERHDAFVIKNRTQKKRYLINPGLTDYMDRFFRDPNNPLKNKENCVKSIPGIINVNSEETKVNANDENNKCATKITRSKSKLANNV